MEIKIQELPLSKQIAYAIGQWGWSILVNILSLQLVYFYAPPENAGIPYFIPQFTFLGFLNFVSILAASGRLFDAITDPIIAGLSDRSRHPQGRRIPFLKWGALPSALFLFLIFFPIKHEISILNVVFIFVFQTLFFLFLTMYVTPYFALLAELGHTSNQRLNLSTYISVTYALGIITAAQVPLVSNTIQQVFGITNTSSLQISIGIFAFFSIILMYFPVWFIEEKKYCKSQPIDISILESLKSTFKNPYFIYYVIADFAYFASLTIIMTGLLFYTTVLLFPNDKTKGENLVGILLPLMILISFILYPLVNYLAKRMGKKNLLVFSYAFMSLIFFQVYFLGEKFYNQILPPEAQAFGLIILYSIPLSFVSILPNAILADIAEYDAITTSLPKEGMYFAARTFLQKIGQTFGIFIFAILTLFGKDPYNDLGIRFSGFAGFILTFIATIYIAKYNERELLKVIEK
ncbi:MAG: MFS transporter [Leptospiraceae bacterium]|nr:MFS transporter [Leptospiraceae bacterium]MDW7975583.1 MFS transporter [Leptospiraceae bacterium]